MDRQPTTELIARKSGFTIEEVDLYVLRVTQRIDGDWNVLFRPEVELVAELARKLGPGRSIWISRLEANSSTGNH